MALRTKEAHINILEQKLDECTAQLRAQDAIAKQLQEEKTNWESSREHEDNRADELLKEVENSNAILRKALDDERQQRIWASERLATIEAQLTDVQHQLQTRREELQRQEALVQLKDAAYRTAVQEYQEYKGRAQQVWQEKDALIQALQRGEPVTNGHDATNGDMDEEIEKLRAERDELRHELELRTVDAEMLRRAAQQAQRQTEEERQLHHQDRQRREEALQHYHTTVEQLKAANASLQHLYDTEVQQATNRRLQLEDELRQKDLALARAEKRNQQRAGGKDGDQELEARIQVMAEHLMAKQSQLETTKYEKDALGVQLESANSRVKELERMLRAAQAADAHPTPGHAIDVDTYTSHPSSPFSSLSRRGKLAARIADTSAAIDQLSLQAGRILRRSALLRVAMMTYVMLLHLWVFFVLAFSSLPSPKAHLHVQPQATAS
eukprot:TRINITY_DN95059_c0_g1_i1.p1 TRINITY_DN95059_c0_g1~~TRINITY_DN95059_c0_g1_i1.p1  ORF type:complete len:495 (+),score=121.85 TRINITY_DN95059_c0_g1_i1:167-1486(+)